MQIPWQWCGGGLKSCLRVDGTKILGTLLSQGFCDNAVGDAHGRAPDVVVQHSIGSRCAAAWFWSIVRPFVQITWPEWSNQGLQNLSVGGTMLGCGSLSVHNSTDFTRSRRRCGWRSFNAIGSGRSWLRFACRVSQPAYWASWADALHVIHNRHPVGDTTGR